VLGASPTRFALTADWQAGRMAAGLAARLSNRRYILGTPNAHNGSLLQWLAGMWGLAAAKRGHPHMLGRCAGVAWRQPGLAYYTFTTMPPTCDDVPFSPQLLQAACPSPSIFLRFWRLMDLVPCTAHAAEGAHQHSTAVSQANPGKALMVGTWCWCVTIPWMR
jgi:hypothetical protein